MAKIMGLILPILSILGLWAIILGSFGGSGIRNILGLSQRSYSIYSRMAATTKHSQPLSFEMFGDLPFTFWIAHACAFLAPYKLDSWSRYV